eukprot:1413719-Pleurochrysis_carterae.AAC.2
MNEQQQLGPSERCSFRAGGPAYWLTEKTNAGGETSRALSARRHVSRNTAKALETYKGTCSVKPQAQQADAGDKKLQCATRGSERRMRQDCSMGRGSKRRKDASGEAARLCCESHASRTGRKRCARGLRMCTRYGIGR